MYDPLETSQEYIPSTLYISLYLFLLIFFILLNTTAKNNMNKSKEAMSSIRNAFTSSDYNNETKKNTNIVNIKDNLEEYYKSQIKLAFNKEIMHIITDRNNSSNFEKFSMSVTSIYNVNEATIKKDQEDIIHFIAKISHMNINNRLPKVEITLGELTNNNINVESENNDLTKERILTLYQKLSEFNADMRYISVGIDKASEKSVIFSFFLD